MQKIDKLEILRHGKYFKNSYAKGERYEVPDLPARLAEKAEPWIEWMAEKGDSLGIEVNKRPEDVEGDLRTAIRDKDDYVWKVYLQRRLEGMMNGKRSVRIITESQRKGDQEEYTETMNRLRDCFASSIKVATEEIIGRMSEDKEFDIEEEEKLVKAHNETVDFTVTEMKEVFESDLDKKNTSESDWGFYESIANKVILILFQESNIKERIAGKESASKNSDIKCENCGRYFPKKELSKLIDFEKVKKTNKWKNMKKNERKKYADDKTNKPKTTSHWENINRDFPTPMRESNCKHRWIEISLLERSFYVGLSEYIFAKLQGNDRNEIVPTAFTKQNRQGDGVSSLSIGLRKHESKRLATLKRASRVFSLFILSVLASEKWILRRTGTFDDMVLIHGGEEEEVVRKKGNGQYPNMIRFSEELCSKIEKCDIEDFENKRQNAIFRVLELHRIRWMNCLPEEHLIKTHEDGSGEQFDHEGGYLASRPGSRLRASVLGERLGGQQRVGRTELSERSVQALNILQSTQWEINLDLLNTISTYETDSGKTENGRFEDKDQLINEILIREEFENTYFAQECTIKEALLRLNHIKKIIDNLANVFWHSWALDWRGRLNAKAPLLSPQSSDIDRALIRFKHWKPIGDDGWRWFRIFLFGFFGGKSDSRFQREPSKNLTLKERMDWIDSHESLLRGMVGDWGIPENRKLLGILDAGESPRAKTETFQHIAAIIEYDRLLTECEDGDWSKVKSGHPVHFDASANGLQHVSVLIQNKELAEHVNVISSEQKKDIYEEVCKIGKRNWEESSLKKYLDGLGLRDQSIVLRELVFQRNLSKQPTMTVFYGAKRLDRCFSGRNGKGKPKFLCNTCDKKNCDHLFKAKHRLRCWHEKSPLYISFKESSEVRDLISEGGVLFAKKTTKCGKRSRQEEFVKYLVEAYEKAINEATGNAVPELKSKLKERMNDEEVLSLELPDEFRVKYRYNKRKEAQIMASGLHLHKLIKQVDRSGFHNFLKFINDSDKSDIIIHNGLVRSAIEKFSDEDSDKEKTLLGNVHSWSREYIKQKYSVADLKLELKENGIKRLSRRKKGELVECMINADLVNYWEAIFWHASTKGKTNNVVRAIYQYVHEKLVDSDNDLEKDWLIHSSISITCKFPEFTDELDLQKMKIAAAANFVHSFDGAHMRAIVRELDKKITEKGSHSSIWSVHDSFGTHACDIESMRGVILEEFMRLHNGRTLQSWITNQKVENNKTDKIMIGSSEYEMSNFFIS